MFFKNKEERLVHLRLVMQWLKEEGLLVNLKTCIFIMEELIYLGFVISQGSLKMDPEKVKVVLHLPSPQNLFEVRSFHGLASF